MALLDLLEKTGKHPSERNLDQIWRALFARRLRYDNVVWNALSNIKLSKLQRLQTRAKKLIVNGKYKDGWTCNWLTVNSFIFFDQEVMAYTILHDLCPEKLCHNFTNRSMISEFRTRNRGNLQILKVRLKYAKQIFHFSGVENWNDIPDNI